MIIQEQLMMYIIIAVCVLLTWILSVVFTIKGDKTHKGDEKMNKTLIAIYTLPKIIYCFMVTIFSAVINFGSEYRKMWDILRW
jgi:peptidoglycan biosynthesis protein MviN/MurJ (putative lipid II flippase)